MNVCGERLRALRESMNYSQMKFAQMNAPGWNRQFDRARPTPLPLKSYTLSASPTPSV